MRRLAPAALLVALAGYAGCEVPPRPALPPEPVDRVVNFRFSPPAGSGYAKQTVTEVDLSDSANVTLKLRPSHSVRGWIWNPDTLFGGMQATVTFLSRQTIQGVRAPRYAATTDAEREEDGFPFTLELPGGLYDVLIEPADPSLPPMRIERFLVNQSGDMEPFHYVPSRAMNTLTGKVHRNDANQTELGGLLVRGFDVDGFPMSTIATTGEVDGGGSYRLTFPPGKGPYTLRVWPPEADDPADQQFWPTGRYNNRVTFLDEESGADSGLEIQMNLPLLTGDALNNPVEIVGTVTDPYRTPVENVHVRCEATIESAPKDGIDSSFGAEVLTDSDGEYALAVMPGARYSCRASPPAASDLGVTVVVTETITAVDETRTYYQDLTLDSKIPVTVTIFDAETGARVSGEPGNRPILVANLTGGNAENVSVATEADAEGVFAISLDDDNVYDLTLFPPEGSGLASHTVRNYIALAGSERKLEVGLRRGVGIAGRVLDADGLPLRGLTLVEIFDHPEGSDDARKIGDGANLGFTWADGTFRALIEPPDEP